MIPDRLVEELGDIITLSGPNRNSYCLRESIDRSWLGQVAMNQYNSYSNVAYTKALLRCQRNESERHFWDAVQFTLEQAQLDSEGLERLENTLNSVGYGVVNGRIVPMTGPAPVARQDRSLLEDALSDIGLDDSFLRQIEQGDQSFAQGDDDSAIGRYRVVLDEMLKQMVREIQSKDPQASSRRVNFNLTDSMVDYIKHFNMLTDLEAKLIRTLYSLLSVSGPHQWAWVTTRSNSRFYAVLISSLLLFLVERTRNYQQCP